MYKPFVGRDGYSARETHRRAELMRSKRGKSDYIVKGASSPFDAAMPNMLKYRQLLGMQKSASKTTS